MEEHFILRVPPSVAERLERVLNENTASSDDVDIDLSFLASKEPIADLDIYVDLPIELEHEHGVNYVYDDLEIFDHVMAVSEDPLTYEEAMSSPQKDQWKEAMEAEYDSLISKEDGRTGSFKIGREIFPAALLDMPCVLETYKTYDDNVLIKTADIGQMIMVREEKDPLPDSTEYRHGFTPPMRDARRRRFRREPDLNPELVQKVEQDLISIMSGGTAQDVEVLEQEEEAEDEEPILPPARPPLPRSNSVANEGPSNQNEKSDSEDYD